jgi:DNA-binding NtrC family response regulator
MTAVQTPAPRGTETILLVEPEPESRTLAVFMLSRLGYRVLEARNAIDAVRMFEEGGCGVDLLLTEVRMPRTNGQELARMLGDRAGDMRVLYLADVDYEKVARRNAKQKHLSFLPRPFTMQVLAGKVREALDRPARGWNSMTAASGS